jgi:hypothetical protein
VALTPNEVAASVLDELESAGVENISQLSGKVSQSAESSNCETSDSDDVRPLVEGW